MIHYIHYLLLLNTSQMKCNSKKTENMYYDINLNMRVLTYEFSAFCRWQKTEKLSSCFMFSRSFPKSIDSKFINEICIITMQETRSSAGGETHTYVAVICRAGQLEAFSNVSRINISVSKLILLRERIVYCQKILLINSFAFTIFNQSILLKLHHNYQSNSKALLHQGAWEKS